MRIATATSLVTATVLLACAPLMAQPPPHPRTPAVSARTPATEPGVYRHAGRRFVVRFPRDWQILRSLEDGAVNYVFTPETSSADPRDLTVSLVVSLLAPAKDSVLAGKHPVSMLEQLLPLVRQGEPGLVKEGRIAPARLGNLEAATVRFHGTIKDKTGEFTLQVYLAEDSQLLFLVALVARRAEFDKVRPTFEKILADSRFGREPATRPERSLEARHVVRTYKESVVSIIAQTGTEGGTGTGFIISKSGYVLTNHHVIWNAQANKPHTQFFVEWDESLKKRRVPAQLLRYKRKESTRTFYQLWGVDIALLKIPAGDHEPMPLTPLSDVETGDPVVTLGFPSRGLIEGVSLTVTTGVVTRFNRGPTGEVESLYTDAPFTHGSSGGPCVSLVTGGVIGQNTFGTGVGLEVDGKSLNDLLHYHGVVPIHQAMKEWPTVTELGLSHGAEELDFLDCYALSRLYMARGSLDAAETMAACSVKLHPNSADAHSQWGNVKLLQAVEVLRDQGEDAARALVPDIVRHFDAALERDPTHEDSLTSLAALYLELGQLADATRLADRAIAAAPASHQPYVTRASIALREKRYEDAFRFADRGKAASHDILPDAYLVAGMARYAAGNLEAGRAEYVKASTIHPSSLDARLGLAKYSALKQQTDEAINELQRILSDFPDNPLVYAHMGDYLYSAKRFDQAAEHLRRSIARYVTLGETPPADLFVQLGSALEQQKKAEEAISVYAAALSHRSTGMHAHRLNLHVGTLHAAARRPGVASAHLRWAQAQGSSDELTQLRSRLQPTSLSLGDIKSLVAMSYPTGVATQLIVLSPLDFALRSEDDVKRLVQVERIPPPLIQAIVVSQQQHARAPEVKEGASPQRPPLVGTWVTHGMTPQGMVWGMIVQFTADGAFASQSYVNNVLVGATQGTYRIVGQTIVGQNAQGQTFTYPYQIDGHVLAMNIPDMGGPVQFQRQQGR